MALYTSNLSGLEYGLVKDHGKCDLQKAKSRIANLSMRDQAFSVHVVSFITDFKQHTLADYSCLYIIIFYFSFIFNLFYSHVIAIRCNSALQQVRTGCILCWTAITAWFSVFVFSVMLLFLFLFRDTLAFVFWRRSTCM